MKADLTRSTFDERKHYRSVRMQQGRVQLDADWNEQQDILDHRIEAETADVLGPLAAPADGNGFQITASGATLAIGRGHLYVGGVLCENDQDGLTIDTQPDLPAADCVIVGGKLQGLPPPSGVYLGFIHVWQRHLTALEDASIREVALGGPDTATRVKSLWQVQLLQVSTDSSANPGCLPPPPGWDALTQAPGGMLAARAEAAPDADNPCKLSPTAGYRRLDNLLYRVEIHLVPGADPAFKWSHDNGSIVSSWLSSTAGGAANQLDLGVSTLGRDSVLSFGPGQWVELFDDTTELLGQPGTLVKVVKAEGNTVTVDTTPAAVFPLGAPTDVAKFPRNPRVRRWDGWDYVKNASAATLSGGWLELEDGVQIKFLWKAFTFRHGDYWMFPARTATRIASASVEWPVDGGGNPVYRAPDGVPHLWGRLAMLSFSGGVWTVLDDCRPLFPSLTELTELAYVGGDAQVVFEGDSLTLPRPLEVGVAMGSIPVGAATVRFTVESGVLANGASTQDIVLTPASKGIASVAWTLAAGTPHQYARAVLLEGGAPSATHYLPVHFSASIVEQGSCACTVCVSPEAQKADAAALQSAIDVVVESGGGIVCLDAGEYLLNGPLRIESGSAVVLRGKGLSTRVIADQAAVLISASSDILLERLVIQSHPQDPSAAFATLGVQNTKSFWMENVIVEVIGPNPKAVAMFVGGMLEDMRVIGCRVYGKNGLFGGAMPAAPEATVTIDGLLMADTLFSCALTGVQLFLEKFSLPLTARGNRFASCSTGGILIGSTTPGNPSVEVCSNQFDVQGPSIALVATSARVADNVMKGGREGKTGTTAVFWYSSSSLVLVVPQGGDGQFQVTGNRVTACPGIAIAVAPGSGRAIVSGNQITGGACGIQMTCSADASIAVESNQISDIDVSAEASPYIAALHGIRVIGQKTVRSVRITGNALRNIASAAIEAGKTILGISVENADSLQVADNDIDGFAPAAPFAGKAVGVQVIESTIQVDISGNRILRGVANNVDASKWQGILIGSANDVVIVTARPRKRVTSALNIPASGIASFMAAFDVPASVFQAGVEAPVVRAAVGDSLPWVTVRGNHVFGRGNGETVWARAQQVTFSDNQCFRKAGTPAGAAAVPDVHIQATNITATSNQVLSAQWNPRNPPVSIDLMPPMVEKGFTVLGNITAGRITVRGSDLAAPWAPLNSPT